MSAVETNTVDSPNLAVADVSALAETIASTHWGLSGRFSPLGAEKDIIFKLESETGECFVFRLTGAATGHKLVDLQIKAAAHAATKLKHLEVPEPVLTKDGRRFVDIDRHSSGSMIASVSKWVEGELLVSAPRSEMQALNLGRSLAELSVSLADFEHPVADHAMRWDLRRYGEVVPLVEMIDDAAAGRLVTDAIDRTLSRVKTELEFLPRQVIHADPTPFNVLVSGVDPTRITGIIDFGDVVKTVRIADVAIAACYLIGDTPETALTLPAQVLRGFYEVSALETRELALVVPLMEARHAMTACITLEHAKRRPENAATITKNTRTALHGLEMLQQKSHAEWTEDLLRIAEFGGSL